MGDEGLKFDLGGAATPAAVPLAHIAAFELGPLRVEPALRRVSRGRDSDEQIEPLVMQVLIALASAKGATLSRDDLIEACWDGRIVSDDAINRVISRLRRILERVGAGAVRLETVAKVGYRLTVDEQTIGNDAPQIDRPAPPARGISHKALAFGAAGLVIAAAAVAVGATYSSADVVTVAVESTADSPRDREAMRFASDLTSDLARLTGAISQVNVVDTGQGRVESDPAFLVRIAVERDGGKLAATARLVDTADGSVLWSDHFRDDSGIASRLREQVAVGTAGVMRCGLERSAAMLDDPASMRLFFAACAAVSDEDWPRAESFARQVTERRPDSAAAWACLAMTVLLSAEKGSDGALPPVDKRDAIAFANKAIAIDPHAGRAYIALALAEGNFEPRSIARYEEGLRADPELPALHRGYSQTLYNLGYVRASLAPALRGLALDPASRTAHELAVRRLLAVGRTEDAFAMQARTERSWPGHPGVLYHRAWLLPSYSDPAAALRVVERIESEGGALPPLTGALVRWRSDNAAFDPAVLDREAEAAFANDATSAWGVAMVLSAMGEHERAFAWIARAPKRNVMFQWSILFAPPHAALRRDPRFFAAMAEIGLVDTWRQRGQWPDFCSEPGLVYDCRKEAARLRPTVT